MITGHGHFIPPRSRFCGAGHRRQGDRDITTFDVAPERTAQGREIGPQAGQLTKQQGPEEPAS